jgi:hypothetical protein
MEPNTVDGTDFSAPNYVLPSLLRSGACAFKTIYNSMPADLPSKRWGHFLSRQLGSFSRGH